jgi:hypothetical protein
VSEAQVTEGADNVFPLFPDLAKREAPPTPEEIAEYRRIRPQLLQMLREWEAVKATGGCPIARRITMND